MQLFVRNIPIATPDWKLELAIAQRLHSPPLSAEHPGSDRPLNFRLKKAFVNRLGRHRYAAAKSARLVIPVKQVASAFLMSVQEVPIRISGRAITICFDRRSQPRADSFEALLSDPHPGIAAIKLAGARYSLALPCRISNVQVGGRSRDGAFVIEAELLGNDQHQALDAAVRVEPEGPARIAIALVSREYDHLSQISIPLRAIDGIYIDEGAENADSSYVVILCHHPVTLQSVPNSEDHKIFCGRLDGKKPKPPPVDASDSELEMWEMLAELETIRLDRLSVLRGKEAQSPYILNDFRIKGHGLLHYFRQICTTYGLRAPVELHVPCTYTSSYSTTELQVVDKRLAGWPLPIAYQAQALLSKRLLMPSEVISAARTVERLLPRREDIGTAAQALELLCQMPCLLPVYFEAIKQPNFRPLDLEAEVIRAVNLAKPLKKHALPDETAYHRVGHVRLTPTGLDLEGPLPDVSNRVLRQYESHHMHFLRVTFSEENALERFRITREDNTAKFIRERFGTPMKSGLRLAGRLFDFLAYSQSSLKDHTVWFVTPFTMGTVVITAQIIRDSLGNFASTLPYPARYAARLSQGFTTTYSSLTVAPEQVETVADIKRGGYTFSDGCGSISPDLATSITNYLYERGRISAVGASAFQIRWGGCKGMLFKNPMLQGSKITIRPSMVKFTDSPCRMIEIAEVFAKPRLLVLNRPLVQILEHLGVPAQAFIDLQDKVVSDICSGTSSLVAAIPFLQNNSLGEVFLVPEVLKHLRDLKIEVLPDSLRFFLEDTLLFARVTMLRGVKFECHLPLSGCYNLVGGFDESAVLQSDEVFIVVQDDSQDGPLYIEGDVVITRSPVVHPGDVRKVRAIGRPTTAFLRMQVNVIIFSGHGSRPVPDMTGGGDLDGDQYHIITEKAKYLWPTKFAEPSSYGAASLRDLGSPATIDDVADFVVDYMVSDILGVVCTRLMHIADDADDGFDDARCRELASLATAAVDFPKSGTPVLIDHLPKSDRWEKPDFMADETRYKEKAQGDFYNSSKVLGVLFRRVELPAEPTSAERPRLRITALTERASYIEVVHSLARSWLGISEDVQAPSGIRDLYSYYCVEVSRIASAYKIAEVPVNEAEIFLGALAATGKKLKRKTNMKAMHTDTTYLLKVIRAGLLPKQPEMAQERDWKIALAESYAAWTFSLQDLNQCGACSFNLMAFEAIVRCIGKLQSF